MEAGSVGETGFPCFLSTWQASTTFAVLSTAHRLSNCPRIWQLTLVGGIFLLCKLLYTYFTLSLCQCYYFQTLLLGHCNSANTKGFLGTFGQVCVLNFVYSSSHSEVVGRNIDDWKTFLVLEESTGDESI